MAFPICVGCRFRDRDVRGVFDYIFLRGAALRAVAALETPSASEATAGREPRFGCPDGGGRVLGGLLHVRAGA